MRGKKVEGGLLQRGLIINQNNGMDWALIFTGPTFNALLQIAGLWPLPVPLIDFAGANFYARATAVANLLIQLGMHRGTCSKKGKGAHRLTRNPALTDPPPGLDCLYPFYLGHRFFQCPFDAHLQGHL